MSDSGPSGSDLRPDLGDVSAVASANANQPSRVFRMVAMVATVLALLAISIPFIFETHIDGEPAEAAAIAPMASHDAVPASSDPQSEAACTSEPKAANLNFTMKDLDGRDVSLASFKGKVMLLNFWATWCGPCKAEIPMFVELQKKYAANGFTVVGYSIDDEAPQARTFASEYQMNYPILLGLGREDVQDAFGPMWGIPVSVLITRNGQVCQKHTGLPTKTELEKGIKALL
jgi:cytochrome c biogenesis protein CcmG/thiol:disulfide interchange protein DsbE